MPDQRALVDEADHRRPQTDDERVVRLSATRSAAIDLDRVWPAFANEATDWLGPPAGTDELGLARYLCDLELRVSPEKRAIFRKAAIVSVGRPVRRIDGWSVPIEWRAVTLVPLFPVFVGRLTVRSDGLRLDGHYAPPFGVLGHVLDRALLGIAARRAAFWFLARIEAVTREGLVQTVSRAGRNGTPNRDARPGMAAAEPQPDSVARSIRPGTM